MNKTHIKDIFIPEGRFRPVKDKVEDIAQSLVQFGQLQPIIVTYDKERGSLILVDGLHRITAAQMNGWDQIGYELMESLDPLTARKIELEANIQRIDMTWQERVNALAELHKLEMETNPNATQAQTAQLAGVRQRDVSEAIKLQSMMKLFPEIAEAKSINQAMSWSEAKAKRVMRVKDVKDRKEDYADVEERIVLGDSVEVIKTLPDEQFDLILTDPPFGISYEHQVAGTSGSLSAYADDEQSYVRLLSMAPDLYRVVKPDGWLTWFLGISWYERAKQTFREAGFLVDEIPVIWDRSEGRCFTSRPDRYYARGYDIALHCLKGNPQVIQRGRPNIIRATPIGASERELLVERPVELYVEIIKRLTVEGETVADFFTGSGSVLAAAAETNRKFWGCELNPERRAYAIQKVKAHIPQRDAPAASRVIMEAEAGKLASP